MAIVKPYFATRRFISTAADGTINVLNLDFVVADFTLGNDAAAFPTSYAYYNLYINGILQVSATSTLTAGTLSIIGGAALQTDSPGEIITLEFGVN